MLAPADLIAAVASTLRGQVAPAVEEPFAKTQAFMAAVVLEKLAGELRAAATEPRDARPRLVADLRDEVGPTPPRDLVAAIDELERDGGAARWRAVVEALYASRARLGQARFDTALARVRADLRARLDHTLISAS